MKTRVLLFLLMLFLVSGGYAQVVPALGSLRGLTVAGKTHFVSKGQNIINGEVAAPQVVKGLRARSAAGVREAQTEVVKIFEELKRQKPTKVLNGNLSGAKLGPGVYRVQGNAQLSETLELMAGEQGEGVYIFQVEGDLSVAPSFEIKLHNGARSKNVFWQVAGSVKLGGSSSFKGTLVATGDIVAQKGTEVQGALWSTAGGVSVESVTVLEELFSDMVVKQEIAKGPYSKGDKIDYIVTLINSGPHDNSKVILKFSGVGMSIFGQPKTLYHFSGKDPGASEYKLFPSYITWTYFPGKFPAGDSVVYSVKINIEETEFSTSILTVVGDNVDSNILNNSVEKSLCATAPAPGPITGKASLCINSSGNVFEVADMVEARKFNWYLPQGWVITRGAGTNRIEVTTNDVQADGVVSVKAENACGESIASTFKVTTVAVPPPMPKAVTGANAICVGQQGLLYSIEEVPGAISYNWEIPSGWVIVEGKGTNAIKVNSGSAGGILRVTAENGCGASASSELQIVVSPAAPAVPSAIVGEKVVCATGTVTYSIAGVPNATGYTWTTSSGWDIVEGQGSAAVDVKAGEGDGVISVRAKNACGESEEIFLSVKGIAAAPALGQITGSADLCYSETTQTYAVAEVLGVKEYKWTVPAGWQIQGGHGTNKITVKVGTDGGEISVVAVGVCNTEDKATFQVAVSNKVPEAPSAIKGLVLPCVGQAGVEYSINSVDGATEYVWQVPTDWNISSGQGGTSVKVQAGTAGGRVTVFAKNACGTSAGASLAVNTATLAPATPIIQGEAIPCVGKEQVFTVSNAVQGVSYTWELPDGWRLVDGQGSSRLRVLVGAAAGEIKVKAANGCGVSEAGALTVTPSNGVPVGNFEVKGPQAFCAGSTANLTYTIEGSIQGASAYNWGVPAGWTIVSSQGTTLTVRPGQTSGNITLTAANGCGLSAAKSLAVVVSSALTAAPTQINGESTVCAQTEATFNVVAVPGAVTYKWSYPADWTVVRGQGTTTLVVKVGSAGTVSVKGSNGCGDGPAVTKTISIVPGSVAVGKISGETNLCAASAEQTFSVEAVPGVTSYQWTLPASWAILQGGTSNNIKVKVGASGTIQVKVRNLCGVVSESSLAVAYSLQNPATPSAITASANGTSPCAGQGDIKYSVDAVAGATEYVWSVPTGWLITAGGGTREITVKAGSAAGQITVFAKNGCGQSTTSSLAVTPSQSVPAAPVSITGEAMPCIGKQQTYAVQNPVSGVEYRWVLPQGWTLVGKPGAASIIVMAVAGAGEIKVSAANNCGISSEASLTVTPTNGLPAFTSGIAGPVAVCANAGTVEYRISAATAASGYVWEVPSGWEITSSQGKTVILVKPGTTSGEVKVTASNGCGQSTTQRLPVTISAGAPAKPGAISGSFNVCSNANAAYSIAAVPGAKEYVWEVPPGWTILTGRNSTSITVQAGPRTGQVRVTAKNGCGTSIASVLDVNMSQAAPAQVGPISGDKLFCFSSQQRVYSVPEAAGTKDYLWTLPAGWKITSGEKSRTITVQPSSTSGYVKVVAWNYCSTSSDSVQVTVDPAGAISLGPIKGELAPCQNAEGVEYSVAAVAGVTRYTWSLPSGWSIISGVGTNSIRVKTGIAAGNVTVYASTACATSNTVNLAVAPSVSGPAVPVAIKGNQSGCVGSQVTYQVESPVAGTTYQWTLPAGWTLVSDDGTGTIVVKVGTASGNLSVVAKNSCGASQAQTLAVTTANAVPVIGSVKGQAAICEGSVQSYSVDAAAGNVTYQWSLPSGWVVTGGGSTNTIQVKAGAGSGEVTVTAINGCGQSVRKALAVQVAPNSLAAPAEITGDKFLCTNATQANYSIASVTGATGYEWKLPAGWAITRGEGTSAITVSVGATAGRIAVFAKNACGRSTETAVDVQISNAVPAPVGAITGPAEICTGTRVTYHINDVAGATQYQWSFPTTWTYISGQGTTSITLMAVSGGTVSVAAKNGCGNSSSTSAKQVQVLTTNLAKPNIIQVAANHLTPCEGQSGLVFKIDPVVGATSYTWSYPTDWKVQMGQGTNSITLTAGKMSGEVSVVAKNNCAVSPARAIAVAPKVGVPVISGEISGSDAVCSNGGAVVYKVGGVTGADSYNWSFPAGWTLVSGRNTTTLTVIPTSTGTVEFAAFTACGKSAKKNMEVVVTNSVELAVVAIDGPNKFCVGNLAQTYRVAQVAGVTYNWEIPAGWKVLSGAGTHEITVIAEKEGEAVLKVNETTVCGAKMSSSLQVEVAPAIGDIPVIEDESTACSGYQFSVEERAGITYNWTIVSGEREFSIIEGQGTNRIKVKGPDGMPIGQGQIQLEISNRGCSILAEVHDIRPTPQAPTLVVPNTFSPNNDGKNDLWAIEHLLGYPVNELVVLNRWGSEVYRQRGYKNNWNGNGLAEGTYFYVLKVRLCEGQEATFKGFVMLVR